MEKNNIQYFLLFNFAMICIATSGALGSSLVLFPPISIWFRCLIACIILGVYCKLKGFSFALKKGRSTQLVFVSGVLMTLHWIFYFFALIYTNVAISMLAVFTYPMMTTFLEPFFFDVKLKPRSILLSVLMLFGIFFLAPNFDVSDGDTLGLLFGLASGLCYSFRNILAKEEIQTYNGSIIMWYQGMVAIIILIPIFFFEQPNTADIIHDFPFLLGLGLITTSIGHTIFLNSFGKFKISTVSIMSGLQPVYGIILAFIFIHEVPSIRSVIGGSIIMACVAIESYASIKHRAIK